MWREVVEIYLKTRKEHENHWPKYLSRPFAAVLVYAWKDARITPNQISILAFAVSLAGAGVMVGWREWAGLVVSVAIYQLAYILDCVDGMLARVRGGGSPVGHLFDFLLDELKAVILLAAVTARLTLQGGGQLYALVGLGFVVALAVGLSLTTFSRRPEVAGPPKEPSGEPAARPSLLRRAVGLAEKVAQTILIYPCYIVYLALADHIEVYFWVYGATITLYTVRTFLMLAVRLGRPARA